MKKRILSFLLALLMVVSIFPAPAFATDSTDVTITPTETPTEAATETPCGTCGQLGCTSEHLNWCADCQKDDCGQNHCDTCGAIDCTTEHKICDKCGTLDCTADHTNWCADCKVDNCGQNHCPTCRAIDCTKEHKICDKCGTLDCTADHTNWCNICKVDNCGKTHVYCETCQKYDCGENHNATEPTEPATEPVAPIDEGDEEETDPMVGKVVTLNTSDATIYVYSDPPSIAAVTGAYAFPEQLKVTNVKVVDEKTYYQLVPADGYSWPESSNLADGYYYDSTKFTVVEEEKKECPICGETDCTTEHKKCEICEEYDCIKIHFWCDLCEKHDCGKSHLICPACGEVDCTETHTWCPYCADYDCGMEHEDEYKPDTTPVIPSNPQILAGEDVTVVDEFGDALTDGLVMFEGEKTSISAWPNGSADSYQWQVCINNSSMRWADIQGATSKGLLVSPAMFLSIIDYYGSTYVRCVATVGGETKFSDSIPVTVNEAVPQQSVMMLGTSASSVQENAAVTAAETNECSITVNFLYDKTNETAAASAVARVTKGMPYVLDIPTPIVPGYTTANASYKDRITKTYDSVQGSEVINIYYVPTKVNVTIKHFQQRVIGNGYDEYKTEVVQRLTKSAVGSGLAQSYTGFYALAYDETLEVAADGSTVVNIYYDRNYYLINLELGGGTGAEPIYDRYGAPVNIATPTRIGYTFAGWEPAIPSGYTVPLNGAEHTAKWGGQIVNYTVAFWYENADDDNYSFVASAVKTGSAGTTVNGSTFQSESFTGRDNENFTYNDAKTEKTVTISGDGSTVVNVYFTRNRYELIAYRWNCGVAGHDPYNIKCGCSYENWNHWVKVCYVCDKENYVNHICTQTHTFKYQQDISEVYGKILAIGPRWERGPCAGFENMGGVSSTLKEFGGSQYAAPSLLTMPSGDIIIWQSQIVAGELLTGNYFVEMYLESLDQESPASDTRKTHAVYDQNNALVSDNVFFDESTHLTMLLSWMAYEDEYVNATPQGYEPYGAAIYRNNGERVNWITKDRDPHLNWTSNDVKDCTSYFFYVRQKHNLKYFNGDALVKTDILKYGQTLTSTVNPNSLTSPKGPGYEFAGWYLDSACTAEVPWGEMIMPESDVAVYAKWIPMIRTLKTYQAEDKLSGNPLSTFEISNGGRLTDPGAPQPPAAGLNFMGWFYRENGVEKAFNFSMAVTKNLELYAKWSSDTMGYGTVKYMAQIDGQNVEIAPSGTIAGQVGTTKTYDAKFGSELDGTGYFPQYASQSITFSANNTQNDIIFWYTAPGSVPYEIRYVYTDSGKTDVIEEGTSTLATISHTAAYKQGYTVDELSKTLVLATLQENILTFYYTPKTADSKNAPVQVTHYMQSTNGNSYTIASSSNYTGMIGEAQTVTPMTFTGFKTGRVEYYVGTEKTNSNVLTEQGLFIHVYYDRQEYPYEFRFVDENGESLVGVAGITGYKGKALYERDVPYTAPEIPGYTLNSVQTQTITIGLENGETATNNVKTFRYTEKNATIQYFAVGGGTVTPQSQTLKAVTGEQPSSTAAVLNEAYHFEGWYSDQACTQLLTEDTTFEPAKKDEKAWESANYYAKFVAVSYSITYNLEGGTVDGTNPESYTVEDTFTLINPTREGYTFTGWKGTGLTGTTQTVTVAKGCTGDRSYTATWKENTATITYSVDIPNTGTVKQSESGEAQTTITQEINVWTGEPMAVIAAPATGYHFIGWYKDDVEVSKDLSWTPTKTETEMWTDVTYVAKFEINTFELTIATNNQIDSNQSYIFNIVGTAKDGRSIKLQIALDAVDSKTIVGLPAGTYTITDQQGWSWRYAGQTKTVTIADTAPETQTFTYTAMKADKIYWLNGYGNELIPNGTTTRKKK